MPERLRRKEFLDSLPEFTPEYGASFLLQSFRHSQGLQDLQELWFTGLRLARPELRLSPQLQAQILQIAMPLITRILANASHVPTSLEMREAYVANRIESIEEILRKGPGYVLVLTAFISGAANFCQT